MTESSITTESLHISREGGQLIVQVEIRYRRQEGEESVLASVALEPANYTLAELELAAIRRTEALLKARVSALKNGGTLSPELTEQLSEPWKQA